ncbi:hypothetical protein C8R47DRAFT_1075540 [Mycena vitilis]|nr:hypothetical protein C8R47DRAFT_1075540 [Mycena vitilis]
MAVSGQAAGLAARSGWLGQRSGVMSEASDQSTFTNAIMAAARTFDETPPFEYPPLDFFTSEVDSDAERLLGTFDHPGDFQLAPCPSSRTGNAFVYKFTTNNRGVFRSYLMGEVTEIDRSLNGETPRTSLSSLEQRITIKTLDDSTDDTRTRFENDATVLHDVMLSEVDQRRTTLMFPHPEDRIRINSAQHTQIINGPIHVGSRIIADVSLHRRDIYADNGLCKVGKKAMETKETRAC